MLSSFLNSKRAIQVNIQIMRLYSKLKGMLLGHKDILLKLEKLEGKVGKHEENFRIVFDYLRELLSQKSGPMRKIGFKQMHRHRSQS